MDKLLNDHHFYGYDPYDGLSSNNRVLKILFHSKYFRLLFTHFNKRSPINFRSIFSINKAINSKSIALYLSSLIKLNKLSEASTILDLLLNERIKGEDAPCWGYYFDWQSRAFFIPKNTPSIVVTGFSANALLDFYEKTNDEKILKYVSDSILYMLDNLNIYRDKDGICFSYTPVDNSIIYNASAIGLEVIARYLKLSNNSDDKLDAILNDGVQFIIKKQCESGAWAYGMAKNQQFIDHYHTSYILNSLYNVYNNYIPSDELLASIDLGLKFYLNNLFNSDFIPKYYHNSLYPIETHCCGAAIKTLCNLNSEFSGDLLKRAISVAEWSMGNLYDYRKGLFYYQKNKFYYNKINYLRWSQSWIFYGYSHLKYELESNGNSVN